MKLACADFTFPLLDHDRVLNLIRDLRLKGVDIGLFEGRSHLWPSRIFRNLSGSARDLRHQVEDRNLKIADVFLHPATDLHSLALNHPDRKRRTTARNLFEKILEWTRLVDATHVTVLPGTAWKSESNADSLKRAAEELAWRAERAAQDDIIFSVEPHSGSIVPTPRQTARLLQMVPNLTLTLDYTHFTAAGIRDAEVDPLLKHTSHFHARGGRRGRFQVSVAKNTINYPAILSKLKRLKYRGWIELEYVRMDDCRCDEVDNLSETILLRELLKKNS